MRKSFIVSAVAIVALAGLAIPTSASAKDGVHVREVRLQDRCDPATFNAFGHSIGNPDDICAPHDGELITFDEFAAALNPVTHRGIDKWNIHPDVIDINRGDSLRVTVKGGEFHTFSPVDEFGPGCFPLLNEALNLTGPPAADCGLVATTGTQPGAPAVMVSGLSKGEHKFMCLIHPWMQAVVEVS